MHWHAQINVFFARGMMGVQARLPENSSDVFLVLNLFYCFTEGAQWLFHRKLQFSKVSEGFQHFPGGWGVPTFSRGSKC